MKLEKKTKQIIFTAFLLWAVILIFQFTDFDIRFQSLFYNFETKSWILSKDNYLADLIFYSGFKKIFILFSILILSLVLISFFRKIKIIENYKQGLIIFLLSTALIPTTIGALKTISNMPCPCDLIEYGGKYPDIKVFDSYPKDFVQESKIRCWPAGHATMGFSLMALYFVFKQPQNKKIALISAITIGFLTGGYKIIIGDHFLSHTLVTMILAWLVILIIHKLIIKENFEKSTKI
ncbi:phosphatase PAP2 family protein [Aliarcobacter cryaerophilus]|uniref:phosphatase PAP2 family protein n=1 Tax=Aliarcobacter cryaerophilus TaxID=28198 RepID=UPI0021B32EC2|nr:phosphatase PAP2 family protein [Aliarcobacter cryaerophilus]MCT7444516.1 phosphatase PAP2 family protein [Aliarcobacter cryaerophilus]MCT7479044.1 phosphatase PAP2 family protein [Aliarcobacter cryaerophilus]